MRKHLLMSVMVAALGIASVSVNAQNTTAGTDRTVTRVENDMDWGWLGLLGLAGLLGLKRRTPDRDVYTTKAGTAR